MAQNRATGATSAARVRPAFTPTPTVETSLIVEALTAEHSRVSADRARRAATRAPSCAGSRTGIPAADLVPGASAGELRTLLRAKWRGGLPLVAGSALLCGFYLVRAVATKLYLSARRRAPQLFRDYKAALTRLARRCAAAADVQVRKCCASCPSSIALCR